MEKKEMCRALPYGSCPICGHTEFIVLDTTTMAYLTDKKGHVSNMDEVYYNCEGRCLNCGTEFKRFDACESRFIPMSKIRELCNFDLEFRNKYYEENMNPDSMKIKNPMGVDKDE